MISRFSTTPSLLLLCLGSTLCGQASGQPDKSARSFFNRTPEAELRELSTDRPDLTESPYTVDAGWWQVEMDLVSHARDHDTAAGADTQVSALSLAQINLKIGLTNSIDLQTVIASYTRVRTTDRLTGDRATVSGFGDVTSRLKINCWGNDGGDSAFALMPFVKWPTNRHGLGNDSVEGGLIVPYARELPGGWGMGVMTELDLVRNVADEGYTADWVNTITFGRDLAGKLGGYVELAATCTRGADPVTFDCGLTYGATRHLQFDVGANLGLTDAAEDLTLFAGLSFRF
ncbi:MAG: transporter [Opitutaceae bacterium]|nr:transporter [Opitutaceae bacterium]